MNLVTTPSKTQSLHKNKENAAKNTGPRCEAKKQTIQDHSTHWIVISPVDSFIHLPKNPGQEPIALRDPKTHEKNNYLIKLRER